MERLEITKENSPHSGEEKKLILAGALIILLLLLILLANLRLKHISVYGNRKYSEQEITEMILPDGKERNPVIAFVRHKILPHRNYPFVSSYSVSFTGPTSCEIIVYEKNPIGYLEYMSEYMYFDKDGVIIESGTERMDSIPEITGIRFGKIVFGEKLAVSDPALYQKIMNITQQLTAFGISCRTIHFDSVQNVILTLGDGKIKVRLGSDDYLDSKLSVLHDCIGEMESRGMSGTADLSGYHDLNSDSFTFLPDREAEEYDETDPPNP